MFDNLGGGIATLSGANYLYTPNLARLYDLFSQNPGQLTHTLTAANWLASRITNYAHFQETTRPSFTLATAARS